MRVGGERFYLYQSCLLLRRIVVKYQVPDADLGLAHFTGKKSVLPGVFIG